MRFEPSPRSQALRDRVRAFVEERVLPVEQEALDALDREVAPGVPYPAVLDDLRARARSDGLWNLYTLPAAEYAPVCEEMGRSPFVAPMAFNCAAPDSGNAELLDEHGSAAQRDRWLAPLLEGRIRTCFSMTEPATAGSDPTGLACRAVLDGGEWVIDGRKWFTTGALGASLAIVMAVTDPEAPPHERASMLLVPIDAPGLTLVRPVAMMGHAAGPGHWEIAYEDCRVPADAVLGERGQGFRLAQDRLGPGRLHHCLRLVGCAERALELMCRRAAGRSAAGGPLADKQLVQDFIARSRIEIDQARLLTWRAAWRMDTAGKRAARYEVSAAKVAVANSAMAVLDRAIQVHGAEGLTDDTPLARMWRYNRMLRIGDGPDEVHKVAIARAELRRVA